MLAISGEDVYKRQHKTRNIFSGHELFQKPKLFFRTGRNLILPVHREDRKVCISPFAVLRIIDCLLYKSTKGIYRLSGVKIKHLLEILMLEVVVGTFHEPAIHRIGYAEMCIRDRVRGLDVGNLLEHIHQFRQVEELRK